MKGASRLVRDFDDTNLNRPRAPGDGGVVFAGGGRGLLVVPRKSVSATLLELAAWTRPLGPGDVGIAPRGAVRPAPA